MNEGELMHLITRLKFELAQAERRCQIYRAGLDIIAGDCRWVNIQRVVMETIKEAEG